MNSENPGPGFVPNLWTEELLAQLRRNLIIPWQDPNPKTLRRGIPYRLPYRLMRQTFARMIGALLAFGQRHSLITVDEDGVSEWKRLKRYVEYPNPDYDPTITLPATISIPRIGRKP